MYKNLWIDCKLPQFLAESLRSEGPGYWIMGAFDRQRLEVLSEKILGAFLSDK